MASRIKSFRPAPDYDLNAPAKDPPSDGALPLGSIIPAKDKPKRCLNRKGIVTIDNDDVYSNEKKNYRITSLQIKERSGGVWTSFLANAGFPASLSISGASNSSEEYAITCQSIETQWFQPDYKYIFDSLQNDGVRAFGRSRFWVNSVYLVTGVKIARGVSMQSLEQSGQAFTAQATVNADTGAVPGQVGAGAAGNNQTMQAVEWEESDDFVFAYSLIKIKRKRDGTFTEKDVEKGNLFSSEAAKEPEETVDNLNDIWDLASDDEEGGFPETVQADEPID